VWLTSIGAAVYDSHTRLHSVKKCHHAVEILGVQRFR
jgi:hypothetical protein